MLKLREAVCFEQGSLEYTYARLQQYSSWLEVRMVAQFDVALENDDLTSMAECAKVMEEFGRGKAIMQVEQANTVCVKKYL
jgi:hypothetical protein